MLPQTQIRDHKSRREGDVDAVEWNASKCILRLVFCIVAVGRIWFCPITSDSVLIFWTRIHTSVVARRVAGPHIFHPSRVSRSLQRWSSVQNTLIVPKWQRLKTQKMSNRTNLWYHNHFLRCWTIPNQEKRKNRSDYPRPSAHLAALLCPAGNYCSDL